MEYYGNLNNKRFLIIAEYKTEDVFDKSTQIGFLYSKGMIFDYAITHFYEGEIWSSKKGDCHPCDAPSIIVMDSWKGMQKIKRKKKIYYIGQKDDKEFGIYMELPRIGNDKTFEWKRNKRLDLMEVTIKRDNFEYLCVVKPDGNAFVEVKYTKCDNKHRNNVTIARIDIYDASNQDILDAIKKWKFEMLKELNAA